MRVGGFDKFYSVNRIVADIFAALLSNSFNVFASLDLKLCHQIGYMHGRLTLARMGQI